MPPTCLTLPPSHPPTLTYTHTYTPTRPPTHAPKHSPSPSSWRRAGRRFHLHPPAHTSISHGSRLPLSSTACARGGVAYVVLWGEGRGGGGRAGSSTSMHARARVRAHGCPRTKPHAPTPLHTHTLLTRAVSLHARHPPLLERHLASVGQAEVAVVGEGVGAWRQRANVCGGVGGRGLCGGVAGVVRQAGRQAGWLRRLRGRGQPGTRARARTRPVARWQLDVLDEVAHASRLVPELLHIPLRSSRHIQTQLSSTQAVGAAPGANRHASQHPAPTAPLPPRPPPPPTYQVDVLLDDPRQQRHVEER